MTLRDRFFSLAAKYTPETEKISSAWNEIETNYSSNERHYHNLSHLENIFAFLDEAKEKIMDTDAVAWAVFYHDFIYDAARQDNEERSALAALRILNQLKVPFTKIMKVQSLILATKTHESEEGEDSDTDYFLDADLAVLGAEEKEYSRYAENIRKEYSIYPEADYNAGRKKVLEHFLDKERIFKTDHFYKKLEEQARKNLRRDLGVK